MTLPSHVGQARISKANDPPRLRSQWSRTYRIREIRNGNMYIFKIALIRSLSKHHGQQHQRYSAVCTFCMHIFTIGSIAPQSCMHRNRHCHQTCWAAKELCKKAGTNKQHCHPQQIQPLLQQPQWQLAGLTDTIQICVQRKAIYASIGYIACFHGILPDWGQTVLQDIVFDLRVREVSSSLPMRTPDTYTGSTHVLHSVHTLTPAIRLVMIEHCCLAGCLLHKGPFGAGMPASCHFANAAVGAQSIEPLLTNTTRGRRDKWACWGV